MEVAVAKALKPSLRSEFIYQQALREEFLCLNANNVVVGGGDDFSVDDLLDFSNGEFQHASLHYEQQQQYREEEKDSLSFSSQSQDDSSNSISAGVSIFSGELAVPDDDLAELEWVSHFVDDSLPELSLLYPVRPEQAKTWAEPERSPKKTPRFPSETKVPTKARTAKTRKPNARACSFSSPLPSRPSSPSSCSSSVASSTAQQPPAKRQKKRAEAQQEGGAQFQRRCSHCQVQKTPQWRTGPLGAKTLCNACGVRYKSGRLFAEYRPACSPTFSGDIHSNSHRKVLEIRRRKGMVGPDAGPVHSQLVPSC